MSVTVNVNGQAAVGVTAGTGDTINVAVDNVADAVAVTVSANGGPGPTGPQGPQGSPATTIVVGTVTTGAAGSDVTITATPSNSGNTVTLDFSIPRGDKGAAGDVSGMVPLAGGAMNSGAVLTFSNGTQDSEVGGWGFGVELTADNSQNATVEPTAISVQNSTQSSQLTPAGLTLSNGTAVTHGSFDNSTGGAKGIGLICAVGYELNWQGGRLRSVQIGGNATPQTIQSDSPISFPGTGKAPVTINATGITFADGSTQTTAASGGGGGSLAAIATSGSASDLATGTVPAARLPLATTKAAGAIQVGSGLSISSGVLSVTGGAGVSWVSPPASPSSGGAVGQLAQDANYLYACYAAGSWLRVARDPWVVPPSVPQSVSATGNPGSGITAGSVAVTWTAPASTGGELTGYLVQINGGAAVSLGPSATSHAFTGLTYSSSTCNAYTVSVRAVNSAGQSEAAADTASIPESTTPTIYSVTKTPNEGAPGVEYGVYWFRPCVGSWNAYELQLRLYYNGSEVVVSGDEDGWEAGYSGPNQSLTTQTSSTGSQQYQFRVRAKNVTGSTVVATSGWSAVSTS